MVVALGCVFLVVGVAAALFRSDSRDCRDEPDWAAWRETTATGGAFGTERGEDRRRDAARELRRCRSIHGRSRREVRRLLGEPASNDVAVHGDHTFYKYYLGPQYLGVDSDWLDIEFDGEGHAVDVGYPGD
jgi:hypothetical protein